MNGSNTDTQTTWLARSTLGRVLPVLIPFLVALFSATTASANPMDPSGSPGMTGFYWEIYAALSFEVFFVLWLFRHRGFASLRTLGWLTLLNAVTWTLLMKLTFAPRQLFFVGEVTIITVEGIAIYLLARWRWTRPCLRRPITVIEALAASLAGNTVSMIIGEAWSFPFLFRALAVLPSVLWVMAIVTLLWAGLRRHSPRSCS